MFLIAESRISSEIVVSDTYAAMAAHVMLELYEATKVLRLKVIPVHHNFEKHIKLIFAPYFLVTMGFL